jgi:hypothetical protein
MGQSKAFRQYRPIYWLCKVAAHFEEVAHHIHAMTLEDSAAVGIVVSRFGLKTGWQTPLQGFLPRSGLPPGNDLVLEPLLAHVGSHSHAQVAVYDGARFCRAQPQLPEPGQAAVIIFPQLQVFALVQVGIIELHLQVLGRVIVIQLIDRVTGVEQIGDGLQVGVRVGAASKSGLCGHGPSFLHTWLAITHGAAAAKSAVYEPSYHSHRRYVSDRKCNLVHQRIGLRTYLL